MKKVLMIASVPYMIRMFNMSNIQILQDLGNEVHVACNFYDTSIWTTEQMKQFAAELKEKDICCHQISFSRSPWHVRNFYTSCRQLNILLEENNFSLIHCHTPVAGVISRLVARKRKTRMIYTAHGFHFYKGAPLKNWLIYYPAEWLCSWWTDTLITINQEDYRRAKKRLHARHTVYVPGVGIDMDKFKQGTVDVDKKRAELGLQDTDIMLLSVGELSARKNHEAVIRALYKLGNPRVKYFICGKGMLKSYLLNLIQNIDMSNQIKLLGYRTDISELCQAADLFILPSHQEGVSVALMEAVACKLPVVCSKIRGNEDIVQEYLFDENNVDDLVQVLKKIMITRNELHKKMEKAVKMNYEKLQAYDLSNVSQEMLRIYQTSLLQK